MNDFARRPLRLGLVGVGKIARDSHFPALAASDDFDLVATASHDGSIEDVPAFRTIEAMIAATELDAVSLCTPPFSRLDVAEAAFSAGLHVMLEKPPAATLGGIAAISAAADHHSRTLYASWHSRKAAGVGPAAEWCRTRKIRSVKINWHENIRKWHPGQEWIMAAGGFGVFDPAINALSILTAILPGNIVVRSAQLTYPENCAAPIAAKAQMQSGKTAIDASFDFLQEGEQTWTIAVDADHGRLLLTEGGAKLFIDDSPLSLDAIGEYPALYRDFAALIASSESLVDVAPLRLVADMLLIADRETTSKFIF